MKNLYTTDIAGEEKPHAHIVYLNDEEGYGYTSYNAGHSHKAIFIPEQPEQLDEMGNILVPAQPASIVLEPDPLDGHSHPIKQVTLTAKKESLKDDELVERVYSLLRAGLENEARATKDQKIAEDFYVGEQWAAGVRSELESNDRAALTFNVIQKYIDELSGHQRKRRSDIKYLPMEEGDQRTSDLFSFVAKYILEKCSYQAEESDVFDNMVIGGRGFFNVYISTEKDLRGDIIVENYNPQDAILGPHEKKDGSDCEHRLKTKMYSLPKLKQLFGDKADDIQKDFEVYFTDPSPHTTYPDSQYELSKNRAPTSFAIADDVYENISISKKEFRLIECQELEFTKYFIAINTEEDFYLKLQDWDKKTIDLMKQMQGFTLLERVEPRVRITKIAGNTLLDTTLTDSDMFFIIPVYAKKRGNRFWGKVGPAIDAQKEVNYRKSQIIDILNRMAGGTGWFIDSDTFPENEKENFRKKASKPGFIQEVNQLSKIPIRVEGSGFPNGLMQGAELALRDVSELMNINVEPNGANESGTMFMQRIEQRLRGNENLFDNLSFAKKQLGRILLRLIKKYYSASRIYRIISNDKFIRQMQESGEEVPAFTLEEIQDILGNFAEDNYDVVITESAYSPTMRTATLVLLSEMAQTGAIQVPPEVFLELADLPKETKDKLTRIYQQQQEAAMKEAEMTKSMEMEKTALAHLDTLQANGISVQQAIPSLAQNFQSGPIDPNTGQPLQPTQ